MKNLALLLVISAGSTFLQAQVTRIQLDSVVTNRYMHPENDTKYVYTYQEDEIESLGYRWQPLTSSWRPFLKTTYQYSGNERVTTVYNWRNDTQTWAPDSKTADTFDASEKLIESIEFQWDESLNTWEPDTRYSLDNVNPPSYWEDVYETWNTNLNEWQYSRKNAKWADAAGNLIELIDYAGVNNSWILTGLSERHLYGYNANNDAISYENYRWMPSNSTWMPITKHTYFYAPDSSYVALDIYSFNIPQQAWVFVYRPVEEHYTYNPEGRVAEIIQLTGNPLDNNLKFTYTYDVEGNVTDYSRFTWGDVPEIWVPESQDIKVYDLSLSSEGVRCPPNHAETLKDAILISRDYYTNFQSFELLFQDFYYYSEFITGTDEAPASEALKLFPNPVRDLLTPGANAPRASSYQITDLNGRILQQEKSWDGDGIDVSWLIPGSYVIRLIEGNRIITGKFIKL
ncbi:MAG: T9SS type A sorting domain-containing protein [Saprospiraceae bacterium]